MRTQLVTGALAVVATSALLGLGTTTATARTATAPDPMQPDPTQPGTTHEAGIVLECAGFAGRVPVRANLYENETYGHHLEVLVHDGTRREVGRSVEVRKPFLVDGRVHAATRVDGRRITVSGTAEPTGRVKRVDEHHQDAGLDIHAKGKHRLLDPQLVATYRGRTGTLTCDAAFAFDLTVTKTSLAD